ncbi:hypothetical protein FRIG_14445 [Frigoribacterium faeni]|uniref:hypothetical protein n=1 Tax=Frigoribacterium faeni TaxID=145483 RepID=UPI001FAC100D|nr:hypothetical protein [Frigoribacterium faeni]MCJ0702317.1 hypothetical protein [Frigoribacterium faeni]
MHPRPLPPPLARGPFSTATALSHGVAPHRLRAHDLRSPFHGVRSPSQAEGLVGRCREFAPLLRLDEYFAHETALALAGLPTPRRSEPGPLHIGTTRSRQRRRAGVVGHRLVPATLHDIGGLPVADPVDALVQAANDIGLDDLVRLGDAMAGSWSSHAFARELPVTTLQAAASVRGRPGIRRLREALELVRPGVDSPQETDLRLLIVRAGLPEPEVNVKRYAADGSYLGKPDLSYGCCRLALEYQGDHHRTDLETWRYDLARRERFEDEGWRVVLVSRDDLYGAAAAVLTARIRRYLARCESR